MNEQQVADKNSFFSWISDEILELIFSSIDQPPDRQAVSEVCKRWYRAHARTRKRLTITFAYAASPPQLTGRFTNLQGLTIKGKPRVSEYGLVSSDWGGYSHPWILELVEAKSRIGAYSALSSIHFKRLEVSDDDLCLLAQNFNSSLRALNLHKCNGFSTRGLLAITRACRYLQVFYLEESQIEDSGSEWIHELAIGAAPNLEILSLFLTGLDLQHPADLVALVNNCKSLRSLRLNEVGSIGLSRDVFNPAKCLRELSLTFGESDRKSINIRFPETLRSFAGDILFPVDRTFTANLVELDLMSTALNAEEHMEVIKCCPNLEVLKLRNIIGDAGVESVAEHCSKLRRIRIENLEDEKRSFSHRGIFSLASGCANLQHVAIYVTDITNAALQAFGENCPNMVDFRVAILESGETLANTHFPLDSGVKALLEGCRKITKLAIYLQRGGLSDEGLAVIGTLGEKLTWLLLGYVGYSDLGFIRMAAGCRSLMKLEMRGCPFTETGIATGIRMMNKLRFVWIQKYHEVNPYDLLQMGEWVVEYLVSGDDEKSASQILAYRSVAPHRIDYPPSVIPLSLLASGLTYYDAPSCSDDNIETKP